MTRSHDDVVQNQFGPRAAAYVQSAVHAGRSTWGRAEATSPIDWRSTPALSSP